MADTYKQPLPMRCVSLTCKSMLVYGEDFEKDPEYQAGMVEFQCVRTGNNLGPDHGTVSMEFCQSPHRPCYREY